MGWSWPSCARPSTVVISDPSACTANIVHDFTASPFISTVQAPQYVVSQPTCVPVRSQFSRRNSTSNKRASTSREYGLPFTLIWTLIFSGAMASGIEMAPFDLFSACAARGNLNRPLDERDDQLTLVFGRPAYVGLRIGGGAGRFGSGSHCFVAQHLSAECSLGICRAN